MDGTRDVSPRGAFSAARLHRSGEGAQRVLLVADGALLRTPGGIPFAECLADRVAARTGRGLDLDVAWDLAPVLRAVTRSIDAWRLWRYEVVVVLAPSRGHGGAGRWRAARIGRIAERVLPELAEASSVLVVRPGHEHAGGSPWDGPAVTTIRVASEPDAPPAPRATDAVAARVAELLRVAHARATDGDGRTASERRAVPQAEDERQGAVDRVTEALGGLTPHLERVVLLARNTFGVPFAQVNLLDHGRVRTLAYVGGPGDAAEQPICTITIQGSGPTIIGDTWTDHRLDTNPHVHGPEHPVRFYAAHPIESVDGYRVGTLCVFDLEPHDVQDVDPSALRDLALLAEAEISTLP
ncbi:hypothetical protein [Amnibacterium sp.]|uniref:hypothetical protein n=1 Tax=Amnibacterium sp. TaxID=1872496 RepID=UPI003F7B9F35